MINITQVKFYKKFGPLVRNNLIKISYFYACLNRKRSQVQRQPTN